jgi:hypothetical protein
MEKILTIILIILFSTAAFSAQDSLISNIKEKENRAREYAKSSIEEAEYFSNLVTLLNKAVKNKSRYGKESRIEILKGLRSDKIPASSKEAAYEFIIENDPSFAEFLKTNTVSINIKADKKKIDEIILNQFSDAIQLSLKKNSIIHKNSDSDILITINLEITSQQVPIPEFKMKSQRASGLIRILSKDGSLKSSTHISEPAAHIDEKTASKTAVKKLSDKAANFILDYFMQESIK